tara:strand:- start:887 stop:1045 length:159 start_codon:yes stop_codon:yes gene_type:complete
MKRSVTVVKGEGEDTFNDLIIMEADEYEHIFGRDEHIGFVFPEDSSEEDAED